MTEGREPVFATIDEAVADIRAGKMVIVVDDADRENEGDFIMAAEKATPETLNFMVTHGRGIVCMPMTQQRLDELRIPLMVSKNNESHGTAFAVSIDVQGRTTTGTSAFDRAATVRAVADPDLRPEDIRMPGTAARANIPPTAPVSPGVDPEQAFVASLSSCHMLWFLHLACAAKLVVDRYVDRAAGVLEKNGEGKLAMIRVTLKPSVTFNGAQPTGAEVRALHERAHAKCFIANSVKTEVVVEPEFD